jgi:hypothetical protein
MTKSWVWSLSEDLYLGVEMTDSHLKLRASLLTERGTLALFSTELPLEQHSRSDIDALERTFSRLKTEQASKPLVGA